MEEGTEMPRTLASHPSRAMGQNEEGSPLWSPCDIC